MAGETGTARVVSYLQSLYESIAETLPDIRDDGVTAELVQHASSQADGYAEKLTAEGVSIEPIHLATTESVRKRPRKRKFNLDVHQERHPEVAKFEVRWLPPSTMKEHWETMQSLDGREKVSFSCFWRTWHVEFPHLKIRAASSHSQCSTCLKHKVLVRDLSNHLAARQAQQQLLQHHLMAQYRDRQVYWSLRGASRLRSAQQITVIMDGMDQCKFSFPRSGAMASKELCNLNRPRLQVTGAIVHGYGLYFFVSSFDHCKDSSASCEIFAHLLTRLKQRGLDLSTCHINLQSDNTSREVKNNTLLRFVSACVSHRVWAELEACSLAPFFLCDHTR